MAKKPKTIKESLIELLVLAILVGAAAWVLIAVVLHGMQHPPH